MRLGCAQFDPRERYGTAESARRPPPACALSRGSPDLVQRRPVVDGPGAVAITANGQVGRSSAELLSERERNCVARTLLRERYGTAESARRPPPACALSRGSPGLAQRRPVVDGPGAAALPFRPIGAIGSIRASRAIPAAGLLGRGAAKRVSLRRSSGSCPQDEITATSPAGQVVIAHPGAGTRTARCGGSDGVRERHATSACAFALQRAVSPLAASRGRFRAHDQLASSSCSGPTRPARRRSRTRTSSQKFRRHRCVVLVGSVTTNVWAQGSQVPEAATPSRVTEIGAWGTFSNSTWSPVPSAVFTFSLRAPL